MRTSLLEIVTLEQWYLMSLHEWQYICQTLHLIIEFIVKLVHLLSIEKMLQKYSQNGFIHNTKENVNHGAILN